MAEAHADSDLGMGVTLVFAFIALAAAIATAGSAIVSESQGSETMQLLSGVGLAVALLAGGIAIVVIHVYE